MLHFSTEELRWSDSQRLLETVHKRGCVGWRRETGKTHHPAHSFMKMMRFGLHSCSISLHVFSLPHSDMQQMQSQEEMHQKIQHPEVPSDPRASYPFLTSTLFVSRVQHLHDPSNILEWINRCFKGLLSYLVSHSVKRLWVHHLHFKWILLKVYML